MSRNAPHKIHTATRAYLAAWAPAPLKVLRPTHVIHGREKLKAPAAVGWSREWWGNNDPSLNRECEHVCQQLENHLPTLLRDIESRWPVVRGDRALIAQFMALHVVRSDAGRQRVVNARERWLSDMEKHQVGVPLARIAGAVRTDRMLALTLLGDIGKLASIFASMQWTLLRADEPWFITGDQPVCPVPLLADGERRPIDPTVDLGWIDTVEIRFPINPYCALVATWAMEPDTVPAVSAAWANAVNVNGAMSAQARQRWFEDPRRRPPMPPLIVRGLEREFEPLGPGLVPGYNMAAARASPRRLGVLTEIEGMINRGDEQSMFIAEVQPAARDREAEAR